jgi:Flp pilus assembly CpaE family ATPase
MRETCTFYCELEPEHSWRELMRDPLVLDPTLLMSVLVKHKTGLHLLASDYDGLREISVPPDKDRAAVQALHSPSFR